MNKTTPTNWNQTIKDWLESGLNQQEFCRKNNLIPHQFAYNKKKFTEKENKSSMPAFRELELKPQSGIHLELKFDPASKELSFRFRF